MPSALFSSSSRLLALAAALALTPALIGCVAATDSGEAAATSDDAVTDVNHSKVKRQTIGNCWGYATASWAEAMHRNAKTNEAELNVSESYISFWHWFDEIVGNDLDNGQIQTGGSWEEATRLMSTYGVVTEKAFIATEANAEKSLRQESALAAINKSLKTGALKTAAARRDRALVRSELVKAWKLTKTVVTSLDKVFGVGVTGTASSPVTTATATIVKTTSEIAAAYTMGPGKPMVTKTLADAIDDWGTVRYPKTRSGSGVAGRAFEKRFQRALHDGQPVIISWFVDFNALDDQGRFFEPPATPGSQGGHMTVMEDYQVEVGAPFGTLPAGILETRPAALEAALADSAKITFIRVKNSWGSSRADRQFAVPGYHDLYMKYLNGPVKQCEERADGSPDLKSCADTRPFRDMVLPPGY